MWGRNAVNYNIPIFSQVDAGGYVNLFNSTTYSAPGGGSRRFLESTLLHNSDDIALAYQTTIKHQNAMKTISSVGNFISVSSVALDVATGINTNIQNNEKKEKIAGDAVGDIIVSSGNVLVTKAVATAATTATLAAFAKAGAGVGAVTAFGVGAVVGAIAGVVAGALYIVATDIIKDESGKSLRQNIQDFFTRGFEKGPIENRYSIL